MLEQVVFCHRFNKQDSFLQAKPMVDYSVVRDPLYKYSRHAQETFFKVPVLAYLFGWFCNSQQGRQFMQTRSSDTSQCADFDKKMLCEAEQMFEVCLDKLTQDNCLGQYLARAATLNM